MERLLATPTTSPCFPEKSAMHVVSAARRTNESCCENYGGFELAAALPAAAARALAAAPLSGTAGAATLPGSVALALALRPAATGARTTLAAESRLARLGLPLGVTLTMAAAAVALPVA